MAQRFGPVGECIYCRANQYAPDSNRPLATEHIIPYGLNGDFELLGASCRSCERITGSVESSVLRGHLLGSRTAIGLRSRRGPLKDPLPLFVGPDHKTPIKVPPKDCPSVLLLPHLADPAVTWAINGWGEPPQPPLPYIRWFNYQPKILREKYGIDQFTMPMLNAPLFCRMIAKIAHAWAIANFGMNEFQPLLADHIRDPDKDSRAILPFVGGIPPEPAIGPLHAIEANWRTFKGGRPLMIAHVRLFANLGAPTYRVVVGTERSAVLAPLPKCSVSTDALRKAYRIAVRVE